MTADNAKSFTAMISAIFCSGALLIAAASFPLPI